MLDALSPIGESIAGEAGTGDSVDGEAYFDSPGVWTTVFVDAGSIGVADPERDGLVSKETLCR